MNTRIIDGITLTEVPDDVWADFVSSGELCSNSEYNNKDIELLVCKREGKVVAVVDYKTNPSSYWIAKTTAEGEA